MQDPRLLTLHFALIRPKAKGPGAKCAEREIIVEGAGVLM